MDNNDSDLINKSKCQDHFLKDFIETYKQNRILWDKKHPKYKSRDARDPALQILVDKSSEYFPEANLDFVKTKIDSIRGAFRRERHKVLESKKKAKTNEDVYVPALWYYNHLLFLVGEETEDLEENKQLNKPMYSWSKHHTVILIELLKKHPILYSFDPPPNGSKSKRNKAYRDITDEMIAQTGRHFEVYEVKNKISTIKQQFRRECRDRENKQRKKSTRLWCYDMLQFLKDITKKTSNNNHETYQDDENVSGEETENLWISYENESETITKDEQISEHELTEENRDDIFDTIGKNVAMKLRDMSDDQRIYAENLVNEIMYNGLMERLSAESRISLSGD